MRAARGVGAPQPGRCLAWLRAIEAGDRERCKRATRYCDPGSGRRLRGSGLRRRLRLTPTPYPDEVALSATTRKALRVIGQVALGAALLTAGTGHLTKQREEFQAQVPEWFPADPDVVVVVSGVVELALGAALVATWKQPARASSAPPRPPSSSPCSPATSGSTPGTSTPSGSTPTPSGPSGWCSNRSWWHGPSPPPTRCRSSASAGRWRADYASRSDARTAGSPDSMPHRGHNDGGGE